MGSQIGIFAVAVRLVNGTPRALHDDGRSFHGQPARALSTDGHLRVFPKLVSPPHASTPLAANFLSPFILHHCRSFTYWRDFSAGGCSSAMLCPDCSRLWAKSIAGCRSLSWMKMLTLTLDVGCGCTMVLPTGPYTPCFLAHASKRVDCGFLEECGILAIL